MFMRFEPYSLSSQPMAFPSSTDTQPWIYLYNCTSHFISLKLKKKHRFKQLKDKDLLWLMVSVYRQLTPQIRPGGKT